MRNVGALDGIDRNADQAKIGQLREDAAMTETPVIEPRRKGRSGTKTMLIPSEKMVAAKLRAAPAGEVSDLGGLRRALAAEFGSDACCPVTVQRHLVAIAAKDSAPYWRVVDPGRAFAGRLSGGSERVRQRPADERR